jgi:hypothetical protein
MKVALNFWGLSRSLSYTLQSIQTHIMGPLKTAGIEYDLFLHTYYLVNPLNSIWSGEKDITLNKDEYKLLSPNYYAIENQDDTDKLLHFHEYEKFPDPWNTGFNATHNLIRALYSQLQTVLLMIKSGNRYDVVISLRPDLKIENDLDTSVFPELVSNRSVIYIPDWNHWRGVNDCMAMGSMSAMSVYGSRFLSAQLYAQTNALHSETFLKNYLRAHNITVKETRFRYKRIRANGTSPLFDESNFIYRDTGDAFQP